MSRGRAIAPDGAQSRRFVARAWLFAVVLGVAAPVSAQTPTQPGGAVLPTPEQLRDATPAAPASATRVRVRDQIETAPCLLDSPANAGLRITVTHARFTNLGPVDEGAIADAYRPYLNSEQPIAAICRIRDAVATRLRALGYIASVEVPVQRIEGGNVEFRVLYAKVTQVRVIGQVGHSADLFAAMLQRLIDGEVFNRFRAERTVLLARDVPGYDVDLTLKPASTGAGDMIAEVRLVATPVQVSANVSNLAAPATGRFGAQVRAAINGLLGIGDQTTLSAYTTLTFHKQQIYQAGEQALIGGSGLRIAGHFTYAVTRPELDLGAPVDAHTYYGNAELSYPLRRSSGLNLRADAGFDLLDQDVDFGGAPLSRDRLRIGYLRLDGDAVDLRGVGPGGAIGWRVSGTLEVRHGLDVLGAQRDCSNDLASCAAGGRVPPSVADGDPEATVVRAGADAELHLLRDVLFSLGVRGQYASGPVAGFEQFNLGNYTVGRGYAPGALVGDDGAGVRFEVESRELDASRKLQLKLQPYGFVDAGWVWLRRSFQPSPEHLVSAGGGIRAQVPGFAALDLSGAAPLQTLPGQPHRSPALVLLTASINLVPWRR